MSTDGSRTTPTGSLTASGSYAVVRGDQGDWIGLYGPDGRLIAEGHSFGSSELLRLVGIPHLNIYDVPISDDVGSLPQTLGEVAELGGITEEVRP